MSVILFLRYSQSRDFWGGIHYCSYWLEGRASACKLMGENDDIHRCTHICVCRKGLLIFRKRSDLSYVVQVTQLVCNLFPSPCFPPEPIIIFHVVFHLETCSNKRRRTNEDAKHSSFFIFLFFYFYNSTFSFMFFWGAPWQGRRPTFSDRLQSSLGVLVRLQAFLRRAEGG